MSCIPTSIPATPMPAKIFSCSTRPTLRFLPCLSTKIPCAPLPNRAGPNRKKPGRVRQGMKQPKKTSGKPLPVQKKKPDKTAVQNLKKHDSKLALKPAALRAPLAHHLAQMVRQARPVLLAHPAHLAHLAHLGGQARRVQPGLAGPTGRNRAKQRQTAQALVSKVHKPATPSTMFCATCLQTPLPAVFLKIFTAS